MLGRRGRSGGRLDVGLVWSGWGCGDSILVFLILGLGFLLVWLRQAGRPLFLLDSLALFDRGFLVFSRSGAEVYWRSCGQGLCGICVLAFFLLMAWYHGLRGGNAGIESFGFV